MAVKEPQPLAIRPPPPPPILPKDLLEDGGTTSSKDASGNPILKDIGQHLRAELKSYFKDADVKYIVSGVTGRGGGRGGTEELSRERKRAFKCNYRKSGGNDTGRYGEGRGGLGQPRRWKAHGVGS